MNTGSYVLIAEFRHEGIVTSAGQYVALNLKVVNYFIRHRGALGKVSASE